MGGATRCDRATRVPARSERSSRSASGCSSLARGETAGARGDVAPTPEERTLTTVPAGRLAASILISDVGLFAEAVTRRARRHERYLVDERDRGHRAAAASSGSSVSVTVVWRRFNQEYRLTVSESSDGLHVHGGLIALTAETIRPGRVQAVRLVEPFLWRRSAGAASRSIVAGHQRSKGEGQAQRGRLRTVLPVGSRALAEELLDVLVPDRPASTRRRRRGARGGRPAALPKLALGANRTCVVTSERPAAARHILGAAEKAQSFRRVQGPIQRRLSARERPRGHGRPERARDAARPECRRRRTGR